MVDLVKLKKKNIIESELRGLATRQPWPCHLIIIMVRLLFIPFFLALVALPLGKPGRARSLFPILVALPLGKKLQKKTV